MGRLERIIWNALVWHAKMRHYAFVWRYHLMAAFRFWQAMRRSRGHGFRESIAAPREPGSHPPENRRLKMTQGSASRLPAWAAITPRVAMELLGHEAIVREAYKDPVGVWTWGVGVTNASGHQVHPRYLDRPQTLERVLEVYVWLLREKYAPAVVTAFAGATLTEAQFAAALSFHYNTGAIGRASWVKSWTAGKVATARAEIMNWRSPPEIEARRRAERDLFFSGKWSGAGLVTVWPVRKPSYRPNFSRPQRVDVSALLKAVL